MTAPLRAAALVVAATLAALDPVGAAAAEAGRTLRVCLDENAPPLSMKRGQEARGFDLAVAQAVAERLGTTLAVQWFESELDDEGSPPDQANALLSDGRCRLVGGYPLFAGALGRPKAARARLPQHAGMTPDDRRRWVTLGELVASRGYRFDPLVVALGPGAAGRPIGSLADLKGLRLAAEEGTLADAILMLYGGGVLVGGVTHMVPGPGVLEGLEQGEHDATLIELHRLDAWRARHPDTRLSSSGHYHSLGFNAGFVGLAADGPLIEAVSTALAELLAGDELPGLAAAAGLTWLPPRPPDVRTAIPPARLRGD